MTFMSDESQKDETVESTEAIAEEIKTDAETVEEDKTSDEALATQEREAREKAEKALADKRYKASHQTEEVEVEENVEKPLTATDLQIILAEERQINQKLLQVTQITDKAKSLANSDAEAQLIVEIHKSRTFPSHMSLSEQLEESYVIANGKKLISQRNEAIRALKNKANVSTDTVGTHQKEPEGKETTIPADEREVMQKQGFTWSSTARRFEKKLSNGGTMYRDPKTKKIVVA